MLNRVLWERCHSCPPHLAARTSANLDRLDVFMMLWMLGHLNGRLVVHAKCQGRRDSETKFLEQLKYPDDLLAVKRLTEAA